MPTVISPVITDAGLAAAINMASNGLQLQITHVVIGTGKYNPGYTSVITNRTEKATIAGAVGTGAGAFLVSAYMPAFGGVAYNVSEIAFYAGDPDAGGIAFAIYSHPTAIMFQRNSLDWVGQFALQLVRVPAGSVGVVVDPQASLAVALLSQHLNDANPHPQYIRKYGAGVALPTVDIGTIWHDDYNSLMRWQVFSNNGAAFAGYASVDVGHVKRGPGPTTLKGTLRSGALSYSKATYAAVWHRALHEGLVVAAGGWFPGGHCYLDNGDGTMRIPDLRAAFGRMYDDGAGIDGAGLRLFQNPESATGGSFTVGMGWRGFDGQPTAEESREGLYTMSFNGVTDQATTNVSISANDPHPYNFNELACIQH